SLRGAGGRGALTARRYGATWGCPRAARQRTDVEAHSTRRRVTMRASIHGIRSGAVAALCGLLLTACATAERDRAAETEPLLVAAGFQKRVADTPQKLAHLQQLQPLRIVPHARLGSVYYVFADPNGCRCAYVGTQAAFDQYQGLVLKQTVSQDSVTISREDE